MWPTRIPVRRARLRRLYLRPLQLGALGLAVGLAVVLGDPGRSGAAERGSAPRRPEVTDEWYRVEWLGNPAGWARDAFSADGGVTSEVHLELTRMSNRVTVWLISEFTPSTADHDARIRFKSLQGPGDTLQIECAIGRDSLRVHKRLGSGTTASTHPTPPDLVLPDRIVGLFREPVGPGAQREWSAYEPESDRITRFSARMEGVDTLRHLPEPLEGYRWRIISEAAPGLQVVEWRDSRGSLLRSSTPSLGLLMARVPRDSALAVVGGAELFDRMSVPLDRPLNSSGSYLRVVYRVKGVAPAWTPAPTSAIRVMDRGNGEVRVEVREVNLESSRDMAGFSPRGSGQSGASEAERERALRATLLVEATDPAIRAAAREAVGDASTPWVKALALQKYVARRIEDKQLGVLFASAARTLESGRGDCTEHALLLAALARAEGIPSRVAAGLVAMGGSMAYHLWTELLVDDTWIGLDAALDRAPVDGRYLPLAVSDLADDSIAGIAVGVLGTFQGVDIEVVETEATDP